MGYCGNRKTYAVQASHPQAPQEQSQCQQVTPSSHRLRHHRRHLLFFCRRLHRLPRRALVEGGHRHLPIDQLSPGRGAPETFHSCSHRTATPEREITLLGRSALKRQLGEPCLRDFEKRCSRETSCSLRRIWAEIILCSERRHLGVREGFDKPSESLLRSKFCDPCLWFLLLTKRRYLFHDFTRADHLAVFIAASTSKGTHVPKFILAILYIYYWSLVLILLVTCS
jgi:hypothetical protein